VRDRFIYMPNPDRCSEHLPEFFQKDTRRGREAAAAARKDAYLSLPIREREIEHLEKAILFVKRD